jgi:hypothetical protein
LSDLFSYVADNASRGHDFGQVGGGTGLSLSGGGTLWRPIGCVLSSTAANQSAANCQNSRTAQSAGFSLYLL